LDTADLVASVNRQVNQLFKYLDMFAYCYY